MEFASTDAEATFVLRHLDPRGAYALCVAAGSRPDGRALLQHRDVILYTNGLLSVYSSESHKDLTSNSSSKSNIGRFNDSPSLETIMIPIKADDVISSAYASIGSTIAICAISVLIGEPSKAFPSQGDIEFDVAFPHICSVDYVHQRTKTEESFEIERVLDDMIQFGKVFDLRQLLIEEGKNAFRLNTSITFLSVDGNTSAVAIHAFLAALKAASLPRAMAMNDKIVIDREVLTKLVVMKDIIPISSCVYSDSVGAQIIVDPTRDEEAVMGQSALCLVDGDGDVCHFSLVRVPPHTHIPSIP